MDIKEAFREQIEGRKPLTEETLSNLKNEYYSSGRKIEIGDIPLFAMVIKFPKGNEELPSMTKPPIIFKKSNIPELKIELIMICEKDFDLYEIYERYKIPSQPPHIPMIIKKE